MDYLPKIVIHSTAGYQVEIDGLVEQFRRSGVKLICVVGVDCARIEDIIDELVVGDGSNPPWDVVTTSHPDESLEEAIDFARTCFEDFGGEVQIIQV